MPQRFNVNYVQVDKIIINKSIYVNALVTSFGIAHIVLNVTTLTISISKKNNVWAAQKIKYMI